MENFYLLTGILLYFITVMDIIQTTLSMQGGGWLTGRLSHIFWKIVLIISGRDGKKKILGHAGYILLVKIVILWVVLLWASFFLILISNPDSVLNSSTKLAVDTIGKIYYAGFTISTLGMGDYIPGGNSWRIISNIYSFTGLILLTMSVTYFIPLISAVIEQRKLGIKLSAFGKSSEEIVYNSWNGKNFKFFTDQVSDIADALIKHSQHHRAYPVIHYFHNTKEKNNIILQVARLYDALYIFEYMLKDEVKLEPQTFKPLVVAFENYFEIITEVSHLKFDEVTPALPETEKLSAASLVNENPREENSAKVQNHRKLLYTLVKHDGWSWSLVEKSPS